MMNLKNGDVIDKLKTELNINFYKDVPDWTYMGTLITKNSEEPVLFDDGEYMYTAYNFKEFEKSIINLT
jgi:hypothetical protein